MTLTDAAGATLAVGDEMLLGVKVYADAGGNVALAQDGGGRLSREAAARSLRLASLLARIVAAEDSLSDVMSTLLTKLSQAQADLLYAPLVHGHAINDIEDLEDELNNKQDQHSNLDALSGLTGAADRLAYFTGSGAMSLATFSGTGRNVVAAADAAAVRAVLSLGTAALFNFGTGSIEIPYMGNFVDAEGTAGAPLKLNGSGTIPDHSAARITSGTVAAARLPSASTSVAGIVELATSGETTGGLAVQANDTRLLTEANLMSVWDSFDAIDPNTPGLEFLVKYSGQFYRATY